MGDGRRGGVRSGVMGELFFYTLFTRVSAVLC